MLLFHLNMKKIKVKYTLCQDEKNYFTRQLQNNVKISYRIRVCSFFKNYTFVIHSTTITLHNSAKLYYCQLNKNYAIQELHHF